MNPCPSVVAPSGSDSESILKDTSVAAGGRGYITPPPPHPAAALRDSLPNCHLPATSRAASLTLRILVEPSTAPSDANPANRPRLCAGSPQKQTHKDMSDNEKSGAPTPAPADLSAPASGPADSAAPQAAPASSPAPAFGSFGSTRGSGLARGKRPASSAPANAPATPAGYKPSSLEVITPKSEYRNPFTGETSVGAPPPAEPVATAPAPVAAAPAPVAAPAPAPSPAPVAPATPEAKSEINILPPESTRRSEVRWEAQGAAPRREDRGTFQPRDRRERRDSGPREPRRDEGRLEPRESRREEPRLEPREHAPHRGGERKEEAPRKSGGFLGWLKGLFGKKDKPSGRGEGTQRSHGGGRGHGGHREDSRGPRPEGQQGHGEGDQGGQRRRRRRGGRGRRRDGDRGPRPEGQQGGGAI